MSSPERNSLIAIPLVLLAGLALAVAGSQGGPTLSGLPLFGLLIGLAFTIQGLAFVPAYLLRTEKFYDLTGSLTYIVLTLFAYGFGSRTSPRSALLAVLVMVWAVRLGFFLFQRVLTAGGDARFEDLKGSFSRFLLAWTLQGLWISITVGPALAAILSPISEQVDGFAMIGLLLWAAGFVIEVVADDQKRQFRSDPSNQGKFIDRGLWAWSRHPNYFGEIILWTGIALIAFPALRGWQLIALISPVFVATLLTRVSGIPILEARADEKWGGQEAYEDYKERTPVLIPRPPAT